MRSRHGKFILDLDRLQVENRDGQAVVASADTLESLQDEVEESGLGFPGERDSIMNRLTAARHVRDTSRPPSEPVAVELGLAMVDNNLFHRPVPTEEIQEPVAIFFNGDVYSVLHDTNPQSYHSGPMGFLEAAYEARDLAQRLATTTEPTDQ